MPRARPRAGYGSVAAPRWARRAVQPRAAARLLLSVLAALSVAVMCSAASSPIYLLNTMYATDTYNAKQANAVWLGIDAALSAADYTTVDNRTIDVFEVNSSSGVDMTDIVAVVQAGYAAHPSMLGVIGPYSDATLSAALNSSALQNLGLMYMAPFTGSGAVRTWNDQVYFTRAEPHVELMLIMNYTLYILRTRRTAFMYVSGAAFGDSEYSTLVTTLSSMSLTPAALYSVPYSTTSTTLNTTAFNAMASTSPQVVFVWGVPGPQTEAFLEAMLTDPRTSSAYIITCSFTRQLVFDVYYNLAADSKLTPVAGQILSSSTVLPLTYPSTQHLPIFKQQMGEYIANSGKVNATQWADEAAAVAQFGSPSSSGSSSGSGDFFTEHPSTSQLMLTGWLAGSLIVQTLNEPLWTRNLSSYRAGLFDQNRYIVGGDFVIGDYGAECSGTAEFLGAVCACNQGGHAGVFQDLSAAMWDVVPNSSFSYPQTECYSSSASLVRPLYVTMLNFSDFPALSQAVAEVTYVRRTAAATAESSTFTRNAVTLNVSLTTAQAALTAELANYVVDVITGPVLRSLNVGGTLVSNPIFNRPNLVVAAQNYLFLMPTLDQEMYVLYTQMSSIAAITSISSNVHLVMHGYNSSDVTNIAATLSKTSATFNMPQPTSSFVASTETVGSSLVAKTINLVLGVTVADVADICNFLSADTAAIVVVSFADLSLYYDTLQPAFAALPASVQARLVSFSNLPLWSDTSATAHAASPLLTEFHAMFPNFADHTPSMLRNLVALGFVDSLISAFTGVVNGTTLQDAAYVTGVFTTSGVSFGRFTWGCTTTATSKLCTYKNYGALSIATLSMERALNPSVPVVAAAVSPTLTYRPRTPPGLTAAQRSGIIAGAVVGGLLMLAAVALLVYCCRDSRDNAAAPKSQREPVTLIFTDIESSTAMWAALPQLMADAIAAHHRVIRQLIRKYGCYEVKTVGDSFMIACKDAHSAVQLVCDIQKRLLDYDWGTTEIDVKYREFELARVDTVDDYVPPTARLSAEEYAALWRGLRVRVGVHTGLSDIRYDEVTKGYDYYGDTSNMAARTEAIANGGQVVATETTWWALSDEERAATAHTAMGPQGLRGVPFAVEMYQLNPVPGRKHAALRTEIEVVLPDNDAAEKASSNADALLSSSAAMTGPAVGVAFVLSNTFAPYPPAQRVREMQPLLNKWNVGAPPRNKQVSEEDYCAGLINRLAVRVASVTQAKQRAGSDSGVPHVPSNLIHCVAVNPLTLAAEGSAGASVSRGSTSHTPLSRSFGSPLLREGQGLRHRVVEASMPSRPLRARRSTQNGPGASFPDVVVPFVRQDSAPLTPSRHGAARSRSVSVDPVVVHMPLEMVQRSLPGT